MGRAGGGGGRVGGGRSGGGSFSRSGGGRSFSSSSRPGGSFGGHSSFGGSMHHHRPAHHHHHHAPYHHHHHGGFLFGPWFWGPRYGYGRTVIINNNGNNGGYPGGAYTTQNPQGTPEAATYTEPQPMTIDQKIAQAENLHKEATEGKKKALKVLAFAGVFFAIALLISFLSKNNAYVKADLPGTVDAGFAYDEGFTYNGGKTENACAYFYETTGIPLFFYTLGEYDGTADSCDAYTMDLYDELFSDENHVLIAYYDNVDWWSWAIGENATELMGNYEVNELIDTIYYSWEDYNLSNDAVLAKGIRRYADSMTSGHEDMQVFAVFIYLISGVVAIVAVISYVNNRKDEKYYEEETDKLRMEKMRG